METRPYGGGDSREHLLELDEGTTIRSNPPHPLHGLCCSAINYLLSDYVRKHRLGVVLCNNAAYQVEAATVRGPDVSFLRTDRLHLIPENGFPQGAPDLAVEVLDPDDQPALIQRKVGQYLTAGSPMVWVADPQFRRVTVYQSDGVVTGVQGSEPLTGGHVLPGFSVPVADLFRYR